MTGVELYKFIKPHLGRIEATGSHSADMERLKNFEVYEELINCLLEDLDSSYYNSKNSCEDSIKRINKRSEGLLMDYYNWIADVLRLH